MGHAHLLAGVHAPRPDRRPVLRQRGAAVPRVRPGGAGRGGRGRRVRVLDPVRARRRGPARERVGLRDSQRGAGQPPWPAARRDLGGGDRGPPRPPGRGALGAAACRHARQRGAARLRRAGRPGPSQREGGHPGADVQLRAPRPRRRPAGGPVAPGARPRRRAHRAGRPTLDGGPRHARGVAAWTGLPFDETGPVLVPRALAPVHCDVEHGVAVYVEPNVWVVHRTRG